MTGEQICFMLERIERLCKDPESVITSERFVASVKYIEQAVKAITKQAAWQEDFFETGVKLISCISCCVHVLLRNRFPDETEENLTAMIVPLCSIHSKRI